jgi:hypothetical protein
MLFRTLEKDRRLHSLLNEFVDSEYNRIIKAKQGFDFTDAGQRGQPLPYSGNPAWIGHVPKALYLTADFVQSDMHVDGVGQFDLRLRVLLHEIMHVIDRLHGYSSSPPFLEAMNNTLKTVDVTACRAKHIAFKRAARRGYWDSWNNARIEIRALGLIMGDGYLPSGVICDTPPNSEVWRLEVFADFSSHWLIDPIAPNSYPMAAAVWFERTFPR